MYQFLIAKLTPVVRIVAFVIGGVLVAAAVVATYQFAKSRVTVDVYRERLETLSGEYETLRKTYNEAVKRTAVTELLVEDGHLCVAIRTSDGQEKIVNTPYDPSGEIYVDCVVLEGRLWIRRVFDERTKPEDGTVIDPKLVNVNWQDQSARYGKAIYRSLSEGRWLVTVTGDGSLGLVKASPNDQVTLSPPPPVREYPQIEKEITDAVDEVTATQVIKRLVGKREQP